MDRLWMGADLGITETVVPGVPWKVRAMAWALSAGIRRSFLTGLPRRPMGVVSIGVVPMGAISLGVVGMGILNACVVGMGIAVTGINVMGLWSLAPSNTHEHHANFSEQKQSMAYPSKKIAMEKAAELGCNGAHAMGSLWMPCSEHHASDQ